MCDIRGINNEEVLVTFTDFLEKMPMSGDTRLKEIIEESRDRVITKVVKDFKETYGV